jgi:hypothetical protein
MTKQEAIDYLTEAGKSAGGQFVNVPRDVLLALGGEQQEKATDAGKRRAGNKSKDSDVSGR